MKQKRHPARRGLDKAEPQLRKHFRYLVGDKVAKGDQGEDSADKEAVVALDIYQVEKGGVAHRRVDADGKINVACRLVNRKKIGIVEGLVSLEAAEKHPYGAVLLGPFDLLDGFLDGPQGRDHDPSEPPFSLGAGLGQPADVGAAPMGLDWKS